MQLLAKISAPVRYIALVLIFSLGLPVNAAFAFSVQAIKVIGLQGISRETVISYLPVQVGETFDNAQSASVIRALYGTGFFSNVSLGQQGNALIIHVVERPVLASIDVSGNKTIPKDKLNDVIKTLGLVQGRVFDQSVLDRVQHSLETEYASLGKYNAKITTSVTPQPRNRVNVTVKISEGRSAQVANIRMMGNTAFSNRKLIEQLTLTTPHLWSFLARGDQFSQEKLNASLDALRDFYLDRGYLKFTVESAQATLTPDRHHVYVVIKVNEGALYTVQGYALSGNVILTNTSLQKLIAIKSGSTFSRKAVKTATDNITTALGDLGYAFANVNVSPEVNETQHTVFINFYVDPGSRVYVRQVNFVGNTKTEDSVLRHAIRQFEGSLASISNIKESERQLNLTGYLTDVHVDTLPVNGAPDQVDLNYKVTEGPSAQAIASVGYGTDGFVVNAGLNQNNFLGTGRSLGLNFQNTIYSQTYSLDYNDPYYTPDGVQRGFSLFASKTSGNFNVSSYTQDTYGGVMNYNIPISAQNDFLLLGTGYQDNILKLSSLPPDQLNNFLDKYGRHFNQVLFNTGWSRNGLDRAYMPTQGLYQAVTMNITAPGGGQPLSYYKLNYNANFYQPLIAPGFIFSSRLSLGYGAGIGSTDGLPFFANYYAGGIGFNGQVRGYQTNSLGPHDTFNNGTTPGSDSLGGNKMATGTMALIFPNPLSADKLRTSLFCDAGNVYSSLASARGGTGSGPIRLSTGLGVDWQVPVLNLMLGLSYARPINAQPGDQLQHFQFNIGTNF